MIVMNTNFSCGKRIKELRVERGLSQERVALNAGITPAYLGLVERGQRNATVNIVERICAAMNVTLREFFAERNEDTTLDVVDKQILAQLSGLSKSEKQACLQLVKDAVYLCNLRTKDDDSHVAAV